jgi:integrase
MARVFKKSITRYLDAGGRQVPKGTPGARKVREKSAKWYGRPPGASRPVPLSTNKAAAAIMLGELVKKAEMNRAGVGDAFEEHRRRPLLEHLADYRRELAARDNAASYVATVASRLEALLAGCRFVFIPDLSASRVMDWLADRRRHGPPRLPLEPGKDWFTPREAGAVLGVKARSVGAAVRRHRLGARGHTAARLYPRATVLALQDRLCQGLSVETSNQYLSHLKSFCRWLVKDRRMGDNPLARLEGGNANRDRRHDRRELDVDELRRLLEVTRVSGRGWRGLTGRDRYHLYATACGSGFRAAGLAGLTPESFDLDAEPPTVTLAARRNKSRVLKVQPLPPDLADLLRDYLQNKPAGQPVWGRDCWAKDGAEMLRLDLEEAGIPYEVPGPDGPLFADFHALRHTYLTLGGRAGIDLRTLQEMAGHSTPVLTARYSHRRLHDLAGAVEKLPSFLPDRRGASAALALAATGTDGGAVAPQLPASCSPVAQTADSGRERLRTPEAGEGGKDGSGTGTEPVTEPRVFPGIEASWEPARPPESGEGEGAVSAATVSAPRIDKLFVAKK